jgi:hypothetical protein
MNTYLNQYIFTSGIVLLVVIILGIISWKKRKEPDYFGIFNGGIVFLLFGITMESQIMFFMGLMFLLVGIVNKKNWKKPEDSWKNLTEDQKKLKMLFIAILGLLIAIGLIIWYILTTRLY